MRRVTVVAARGARNKRKEEIAEDHRRREDEKVEFLRGKGTWGGSRATREKEWECIP